MLRWALPASGAVAAQTSQALASLALQVVVARTLGSPGLSTYALLYGGVVLATAVVTGLVGDSLTVVDRSRPEVRGGLAAWALGSAALLAITGALLASAVLGARGGAVLGAVVAVFVLEDCLRRLLMVCDRFWRIVAVDLAALSGALVTVALLSATARGPGLVGFLLALGVGQVVGAVVAVAALPAGERWLAPWRGADLAVVLGFGAWRAAQQTLRPGMLTAGRVLVIAALGGAVYGEVEAARLLVTPLTLVVGGVGSLLLVRYARAAGTSVSGAGGADAAAGRRAGVRRADRSAAALLGASVLLGAGVTAATPLVGDALTSGRFEVDQLAVLGWALYAASAAVVLPYGTLAAVRRRQQAVFLVRCADSVVSVALLALLLRAGAPAAVMPFALSVGSLLSAAVIRSWVLRER